MIDFDTNSGHKHHLNQFVEPRRKAMENDESLQNAVCLDCGRAEATIGFEPDSALKISPYVKDACCNYFKAKINKKIGSRRHLS